VKGERKEGKVSSLSLLLSSFSDDVVDEEKREKKEGGCSG